LARRFRRPKNQVREERLRLKIPPFQVHKGRKWKRAEDKLLSTARDPEIARPLKRSLTSVRARRQVLGVAALPRYPVWTRAQNKLLGRAPDSEVALGVNRSTPAVRKQRLKLGIAAFRPMPEYRSWTAAEDKLVGTMRDDKQAKFLGRTLNAVRQRREKILHRPPCEPKCVLWRPDEDRLLARPHQQRSCCNARMHP
jgi:hypothetical protein